MDTAFNYAKSLAAQQQAGNPPPRSLAEGSTSEIQMILGRLAANIDALATTAQTLIDRIEPILAPEAPSAVNQPPLARLSLSSPLANSVDDILRRVEALDSQLTEARGRICV